jgi:chromosome segregation ATPase
MSRGVDLLLWLIAAFRPVVVSAPGAADGVSTESILVFVAGTLAAVAAVVAALVTTRGAAKRLRETLDAEKHQHEDQLRAEREKSDTERAHEKYLAKRVEASKTIEETTRLVARTSAKFDEVKRTILKEELDVDQLEIQLGSLVAQVDQIREEISVVAIRFGSVSPVVTNMADLLAALLNGLRVAHDALGADEQAKNKLSKASNNVSTAVGAFWAAARTALETY